MKLKERALRYERLTTLANQRLQKLYNLRLLVFFLSLGIICLEVIFQWDFLYLPTIIIAIAAFSFAIVKTRRFKTYVERLERRQSFYQNILARQEGRYTVEEKLDIAHPLSGDLNLNRKNSLIHFLSFFLCEDSKAKVISLFCFEKRSLEQRKKQTQAWKSLKENYSTHLRHYLSISENAFRLKAWRHLVDQTLIDTSKKLSVYLLYGLYALSLVLFVLKPNVAWYVYFVYVLLNLNLLPATYRAFMDSLSLEPRLQDLKSHLQFLHEQDYLQKSYQSEVKKISMAISFLSWQSHPLIALLINFVLPWGITFTLILEKSKKVFQRDWPMITEALLNWDLDFSFATCATFFSTTEAEISDTFSLKEIYHPLMNHLSVVKNSYSQTHSLNLLTGSNMSGKSTFLRTMALNLKLAYIGAPVFAESFKAPHRDVFTCINLEDSQENQISYFYSEVLRLKAIQDGCKQESSFYFIDEIFRGTNNKERYLGAEAFLKAMCAYDSYGWVSTHDLELSQLEKDGIVKNYHFSEDISTGKLHFNYKLQEGPCTTTNALEILKQTGLDLKL